LKEVRMVLKDDGVILIANEAISKENDAYDLQLI